MLHHVHLNELRWAGKFPAGSRQWPTTFEMETVTIEVKMSNLLCTLEQSMLEIGVQKGTDGAQEARKLRYDPGRKRNQADNDAFVVLNNLKLNYINYMVRLTDDMMELINLTSQQ